MCNNHHLDQVTYEKLSNRTQPLFALQRSRIYALFQLYLKKRGERREYDVADRCAPDYRSCCGLAD